MRDKSHSTIAILRSAVNTWRKREDWSRETVVSHIVEHFELQAGHKTTELKFDPPSRDTFERMKANADKVYRWLDDDTKDHNLLPANFIPYIIGALPLDLRITCMDQILAGTGLTVRVQETGIELALQNVLQRMAKEGGEAQAALAGLMDGATADELLVAQKELTEFLAAAQEALRFVESLRTGAKA